MTSPADDPSRSEVDAHAQRNAASARKAPYPKDAAASNRTPTVALVAHDVHDRGGMERVCAELIRRGASQFDFVVISATFAPELRPLVTQWMPVPVPARPFPLKFAIFWLRARSRVRALDADIVHTVGAIVPCRVDAAAVHFCHAGFASTERRLTPQSMPVLRRANTAIARLFALAAERWCYRTTRLRAFAAVSDGVGQELLEHYPGVPVHVTPNGVDRSRFRPDPSARDEVRRAAGLGDEPVAVFVGGDWHRKGLTIVLDALAQVRNAGVDLCLWVVGAGDQGRFSALADELGVGAAVSFLGPRSDVERVLAAADIFVLPSMYETFGLAAFEAAASGLPIVATRVHGISDLLADGDAGILVERDARSVADALTRLASDPALRSRLGKGALERSARYSWRASVASVTDLYRSLLADRDGARA